MSKNSLFSVYGRATPDHETAPILITATSAPAAAHLGNLVFGNLHNITPRCYETLRVVEMYPATQGHVFEINDGELFNVSADGSITLKAA